MSKNAGGVGVEGAGGLKSAEGRGEPENVGGVGVEEAGGSKSAEGRGEPENVGGVGVEEAGGPKSVEGRGESAARAFQVSGRRYTREAHLMLFFVAQRRG
jgi:hypothetical protein